MDAGPLPNLQLSQNQWARALAAKVSCNSYLCTEHIRTIPSSRNIARVTPGGDLIASVRVPAQKEGYRQNFLEFIRSSGVSLSPRDGLMAPFWMFRYYCQSIPVGTQTAHLFWG